MRTKTEHFILNTEEDFMRGCGGTYTEGACYIETTYLSGLFDSGKTDTRWYRIDTTFNLPINSELAITVYTTNELEIEYEGQTYNVQSLLANGDDGTILSQCKVKKVNLQPDILISDMKGRYLFFRLESTVLGEEAPSVKQMKLYFSPNMWVDDLPELYRMEENSFMERYLAIFQKMYEEMEEQIETSSENYDVNHANGEFLQWLGTWFGIRNENLWTEEQFRYILRNAHRIYKGIGTKEVIREICELYLGEKPEIIEYYDKDRMDFKDEYNLGKNRLFINPYVFTVIIKEARLTKLEQRNFRKIIDGFKPAYMDANVIFLRTEIVKEQYMVDEDEINQTNQESIVLV